MDQMANRDTALNRYFTVLDSLPEHVFVFTESGRYVEVFGGAENALGFDCKPFIGKTLYDVAPVELATMFHRCITETLELNRTNVVEYCLGEGNNVDVPDEVNLPDEIWFEGTIKPLPWVEDGERTVVWMAKNITERYRLEKKLKQLSETDELTGIPNRRALMSALKKELKRFQRDQTNAALLMVDIDHFKQINDELGHQAGDEVLKFITNLSKIELRETDFLGRIGGEEFAIILCNTNISKALEVAERLRASIEKSIYTSDIKEIDITISIGATEILKADESIKCILARADRAMYRSKKNGRNQVSVDIAHP